MCGVGVIFCHRNALVCYTCMAFINVVIMGQPIVYATQSNYCENMPFRVNIKSTRTTILYLDGQKISSLLANHVISETKLLFERYLVNYEV